MKKNNVSSTIKPKHAYMGGFLLLALLMATCRNQEKQQKIERLDNQIYNLDNEIKATKNLHDAKIPKRLHSTQARYNNITDSLTYNQDTLDSCIADNEKLVAHAFNNYAMRIGKRFQLSQFLSQKDISTFQQYIAKLDTMEFVQEMARKRILQNNGSLHDLSYFLEMLDLDSVNHVLDKKLAWNFYPDELSDKEFDDTEIAVLNFEDSVLNNALNNETNLLNLAWQSNIAQPNKTDSIFEINTFDSVTQKDVIDRNDSVQLQINNRLEQQETYTNKPNFSIPEFDSVRTRYMRNDSVINAFNTTFSNMLEAEDSLEQYRQEVIRKRDSLVERRNELVR